MTDDVSLGDFLCSTMALACNREPAEIGPTGNRADGELPAYLRTDSAGDATTLGMRIWDYVEARPDRGRVFDDMLATLGAADIDAMERLHMSDHQQHAASRPLAVLRADPAPLKG